MIILFIHVVKPGNTIFNISQQYGVSMAEIVDANELQNPNQLAVGQTLVVPNETLRHTVAWGESVYLIARRYGVTMDALLRANPEIPQSGIIYPGQVITIPSPISKIGTMEVNGYAFPNIKTETLNKTLPYLTYLSLFSYKVHTDGSLSMLDSQPLIQAAKEANVAPLMVITNLEEGGGFNSDIAHTILTDQQIQETLLDNVIQTLENENYYGLDIDFEYIYPDDKDAYIDFLRKVKQRLDPLGYSLTVALAPKTSASQQGLLYEAHDYPEIGSIVDHVILMTYEWGYTYGPPLAVAPINEVRKVLDYAISVIPSQKILMGIPNYGYDWTLPYVPETAAQTISNVGAVERAVQRGAAIQYDQEAQAPYYRYYDDNGKQHIVWFEDARSIAAKLGLVNVYNLGGVSYWTIGRYFPQNWQVLSAMYDVQKKLNT